MKRIIIYSAIALGLAASGIYAMPAVAADAPNSSPAPAWPAGPGANLQHMKPNWSRPGGWEHKDRGFGLFSPVADKNLTPADVTIIASALLLEHGNHDWKVTDVSTETDKSIHFSYATQHGDVVATFTVDPVSGRMKRVS